MIKIQIIIAILGGCMATYIDNIDPLVYTLLAFMIIDYVTGIIVAINKKKLSSNVGFKGIFKKVIILLLVFLSHIVDTYVIEIGSAIETTVILFYLSNEGISILENADEFGVPLPQKLKDIFNEMHDGKKL